MYIYKKTAKGNDTVNNWLEDIYRQHRRGLVGLARSVARRDDVAEDAVHEAFARLARKSDKPSGDPLAYVYRAVRNAAVDQVRKRLAGVSATQVSDQAWLFADPAPSAQQTLEQAEQHQLLMRAVQALPDAQRETIVMKVFGNLTFQQIAEASDQPLSTIASRYQRGLSRLKKELEGSHEPLRA